MGRSILEKFRNKVMDIFSNIARNVFLSMVLAIIAWGGFCDKANAEKSRKPFFELLYSNAMRHSPTKEDGNSLREAIIALYKERYRAAAYKLIPIYNINAGMNDGIEKFGKMPNPGGDNPTYWITLNLTLEGLDKFSAYRKIVMGESKFNEGINAPKKKICVQFYKSIVPAWSVNSIQYLMKENGSWELFEGGDFIKDFRL